MITSIDAKQATDKIQHPSSITKNISTWDGMELIDLMRTRTQFPTTTGNKARPCPLTILFNIVLEVLANAIGRKRKEKVYRLGRREKNTVVIH